MIVDLSDRAKNAMMDSLADLLHGGSVELLTEDKVKLAELQLSDPATKPSSAGELEFTKIKEEDAALMRGTARWARFIDSDRRAVLTVDVGDSQSDAVLKLNTVAIYPGGPVRINSFRLVQP